MSDYIVIDDKVIEKLDEEGVKNGKIMMMYGKILSLSENDRGACCASNGYFARILKTDVRNIQKYMKTLKDKGFVKIFEERSTEEYAFTVMRYVYPQWKIKDGELVDMRTYGQEGTNDSSSTHEQTGDGARTNGRKGVNKKVNQGELLGRRARTDGHPNIREKRDTIYILEGADAENRDRDVPLRYTKDVAGAPKNSANAARLRLPDDLPEEFRSMKFNAKIDDNSMLDVMDIVYREHLEGKNDDWETHEDIRDNLINDFTKGFYCGDKDKVTRYAEFLMKHYEEKVPIQR